MTNEHVWYVYIYIYIYHKNQLNECKYTIPIDPSWDMIFISKEIFHLVTNLWGLGRWQERFLLPDGGAFGKFGEVLCSTKNPMDMLKNGSQ